MQKVRKFFTDKVTRAKMIDQITCLDKFQFVHDEVVQYDDSCGMFVGKNFHGRIANVTLENGLEVCAVKDDTQSHFGVALSIKAGSLDDPVEAQGLAHLLEHVLFHKSEKYDDFVKITEVIAKHGGSINAYTATEETNFHFFIAAEKDMHGVTEDAVTRIRKVLDIFVNQFVAPILSESLIEQEIKVVDNEHKRNATEDLRIVIDFVQHVCGGTHSIQKFSTGNSHTLADSAKVTALAKAFFNTYYVASNMKLCIYGPCNSIVELLGLAHEFFGQIPSTRETVVGLPPIVPRCTEVDGFIPFPKPNLSKVYEFSSVKDNTRMVSISFKIPSTIMHYHTLLETYFTVPMKGTSKGSLVYVLRDLGFIEGMSGQCLSSTKEFSVFSVIIKCTALGIEYHLDDILNIVFGWFEIVKAEGPQRFHCGRIAHFFGKVYGGPLKRENVAARASEVAKQMLFYPLVDRLTAGYLLDRYEPHLLEEMFAAVCVEKAMVCVCHPRAGPFFDKMEPIYKVDYHVSDLQERVGSVEEQMELARLHVLSFPAIPSPTTRTGTFSSFQSPQVAPCALDNDDFPYEFEPVVTLPLPQYIHRNLKDEEESSRSIVRGRSFIDENGVAKVELNVNSPWFWVTDSFRPPVLIKYTPKVMLWLKQRSSYGGLSGKAFMTIRVHSPWVMKSALHSLTAALYLKCVTRHLQKFHNYAFLQGASFELRPNSTGFGIEIATNTFGTCSLKKMVSEILKTLGSEEPLKNSETLHQVKSENPRELTSESRSLLEELLSLKLWLLMDPGPPDALKFLEMIKQVRFRDLVTCFKEIFDGCRTHIMISGNCHPPHAQKLCEIIEAKLVRDERYPLFSRTAPRAISLQREMEYFFIVPSSNSNSAVNVTLQLAKDDYKVQAIAAVLCKMLISPAFAYFRTFKGISYVVSIRFEKVVDIPGIKFECLSNNADPIVLAAFFEDFIKDVVAKDVVGTLTKEKLDIHADTVVNSLVSPFQTAKQEHNQWVHRVLNIATFEFFGHLSMAEEMKRVTVGEVKQFFKDYVCRDGALRRKLVCGEMSASHIKKRFGNGFTPHLSRPLSGDLLRQHIDATNVKIIEDPYEFKYSL